MLTIAGVALSNIGARLGTSPLSLEKKGNAALDTKLTDMLAVTMQQATTKRFTTFLFIDYDLQHLNLITIQGLLKHKEYLVREKVHYLVSLVDVSSWPENNPELCEEKSNGCISALDFSRVGFVLLLRK